MQELKKKILRSVTTIISNDIMKIVQVLGDSNILLKGISKAIENETK